MMPPSIFSKPFSCCKGGGHKEGGGAVDHVTGGWSLTSGWGRHPLDHQGRAMPRKAKEGIDPSREPATPSWALLAGAERCPIVHRAGAGSSDLVQRP